MEIPVTQTGHEHVYLPTKYTYTVFIKESVQKYRQYSE